MSHTIPTPDSALKDFFKNNEIFAALFNGYFFNNENIIHGDELESEDTAYTATLKVKNNGKYKFTTEKISKYRDNIRRTSLGYLVILGIEDQNKIHYSMPIRKMLYDVLGYSSELSALGQTEDKAEWTIDEWLSKTKKGTKVTPILTVVFYTGEDPWDGPKSLHDMMNMDDSIKPFVPDYPLYVIDIGHDKDLSFNNKELTELKDILSSIYAKSADENETIIDNSIIALAGILSGDKRLYLSAIQAKEEKQKMCRALEERDAIIFKEKNDLIAEKDILIADKDAEIADKNAEIADKNAEIADKNAEIEELKKQLAELRK